MAPFDFRTIFLKSDEMHYIAIVTPGDDLIAYAALRQGDEFLEVCSPVARSKFGTLLYQTLAKYAHHNQMFIMSDREGDTRGAAMAKWDELYESVPKSQRIQLPDDINEAIIEMFGDEETDALPLLCGYQLTADPDFLRGLTSVVGSPKAGVFMDLLNKGSEWHIQSYELDTNSWINEEHPLPLEYQFPDYPAAKRISVNDVCVDMSTMDALLLDMHNGEHSRSIDPVEVVIDREGDVIIIDGRHQFFEALLLGQTHIDVTIEFDERLCGKDPDIERPQKSMRWQANTGAPFNGLETLSSESELDLLQARYCDFKGIDVAPLRKMQDKQPFACVSASIAVADPTQNQEGMSFSAAPKRR